MPEDTKNLYDSILQESNHLRPNPVMKLDVKFEDGGAEPIGGHMESLAEVMKYEFDKDGPFQVEVTCTSVAAAYSEKDPADKNHINNYVMLTHDIVFAPIAHTTKHFGVTEYRVRVKPITNINSPSGRKAYWMKHEPGQTEKLINFSKTVTHGVSVNIGFFGDGNIEFSSSVSKTISMTEPSVRCDDHSSSGEINHSFLLTEAGAQKATHQFQLVHLASVPDEGLGDKRAKGQDDAQKLEFALEFEVISKLDSIRYNSVSKKHPASSVQPHPTQIFPVSAPPRPKAE
ncbi:hypothetical protein CC1G_02834 [Coprinopsis cinerea okayama7|uniref:Uncharacterized protein n=1 Tax=Coprinopsis cinerea (strain Okayama-7 / 130 / ATCC MYA-4618 / FGSC 9003) TaxID=240176 RepID=A8N065_COPC7|nr:hypothetical protein CC1G_02834 [Coprinopsis cinerea okayama7\|eukprot:XP_001828253.2 hypothetical protein CC1G_02834 [Coprinopsis cinerea okayama7\